MLRDCVGSYACCPEAGLRVHPESVVWEIFRKGRPVNLTELHEYSDRPHSLPEPVAVKAVLPLRIGDIGEDRGRKLGVLVVDAGDPAKPIEDRDFQYLEVLGMLISGILERSILMERIQAIQREKERMAREMADLVRNRFAVIGGFARRLARALKEHELRRSAEIIADEVKEGEAALDHWMKMLCAGDERS